MAHLVDGGVPGGRTSRLSAAFCLDMLGGLPPGLIARLIAHPDFAPYVEIVAGDTEFIHHPGELYQPVAVGYCELRSGRAGVLFADELGSEPPHAHGPDVLFVGFTGAEPEFYQSVDWGFDSAFLDLRVEGIYQTNTALPRGDPRRLRLPRSLIDFAVASGIKDGDAALKDAMRDRIIRGPPYTEKEISEILKYCFSDVSLLIRLLDARLPCIPNFKQALARGEYVKFTAEIFRRGQPADPWAAPLLRQKEVRKAIRLRAVSDTSLTYGLYTGSTLKDAKVQEFVLRHGLSSSWRTTKSGKLGKAYRDFVALEAAYQKTGQFKGLADAHKTISQLHELQLFSGADGRYRTPIWAFSTITGRSAPNGSEFPFTTAAWSP